MYVTTRNIRYFLYLSTGIIHFLGFVNLKSHTFGNGVYKTGKIWQIPPLQRP